MPYKKAHWQVTLVHDRDKDTGLCACREADLVVPGGHVAGPFNMNANAYRAAREIADKSSIGGMHAFRFFQEESSARAWAKELSSRWRRVFPKDMYQVSLSTPLMGFCFLTSNSRGMEEITGILKQKFPSVRYKTNGQNGIVMAFLDCIDDGQFYRACQKLHDASAAPSHILTQALDGHVTGEIIASHHLDRENRLRDAMAEETGRARPRARP